MLLKDIRNNRTFKIIFIIILLIIIFDDLILALINEYIFKEENKENEENEENHIKENIHLKDKLRHTSVIHVPNRNVISVQGMISNNLYKDLNINLIVQPYINEMNCNHGGACHCNLYTLEYFYPSYDIQMPTKQLDQLHKNYMCKSGELKGHPGNKYP